MKTTYGLLFAYHQQIQEWARNGSIFYEFFTPKIKQFYNDHSLRLQTFQENLKKLQAEHMILKEDGSYDTKEEPYTDEQGNEKKRKVVQFKDGKTQADFQKKYMELCETPVGERIKIFDTLAPIGK